MPATETEVLIVGAGAAASVFASVLAQAGREVTALETGPARQMDDLYSSNIWSRRLKWAEPHVAETTQDSIYFNLNAGRGFGGAAAHHFAVWPRYHEDDFKLQSEFGRGLDWPMEYADLQAFYDRVQSDVGVAGDAKAEIWRPPGEPYPLPPVPMFPQAEVLAKGFEAMDMSLAPLPVAVLTQPYKGRPACIWDGWCEAGCPTGALANPLAVYLPEATRAGAILQADSHVSRVLTDGKGRATGAEYFDASGQRQEIRADVVVLTAFTVENVRILLNSAEGGLGNSSGLLGLFLTTHPAISVFGLFDQDIQPHVGLSGGLLLNQDDWNKEKRGGAFGSVQWEVAQAMKPNDLLGLAMSRPDLFHRDLEAFMQQASRGLAQMVGLCEDLPLRQNRIELSSNKDAYGFPLAQVTYNTSPASMQLWRQTVRKGNQLMRAAGAREVWNGPKAAQHTMGGTIMGDDPGRSVANANGQSHDIPNLFFGGGGLFPSSSAVNSTFTLHALAMKSAEFLRDNWSSVTKYTASVATDRHCRSASPVLVQESAARAPPGSRQTQGIQAPGPRPHIEPRRSVLRRKALPGRPRSRTAKWAAAKR